MYDIDGPKELALVLAERLGIPTSAVIDVTTPIRYLGIDSLGALELYEMMSDLAGEEFTPDLELVERSVSELHSWLMGAPRR